ncbi:hypothetical protein [Pseudorhodoplanes sp.]|uniref:hypothetical protein n=1 Tax=Pseudorhodoplanes sp. TaxID=1934341 RepID=UPI002CE49371|nr:hypothetical protein [Pseudorhodoplanes sp.]HWV51382.1 hypothetical protein [Pseudorhodoplanes sp.]
MKRRRTLRAQNRAAPLRRAVRFFDEDEEIDEQILELGFIETRDTPVTGASVQSVTSS